MSDDISTTIAPKSDQLNADDLIDGRSITITITELKVKSGTEQPASIHYEGDNGKPYKPCLSMRRLLLVVWGSSKDGAYRGRKLVLYNDKKVRFGPEQTGGIRISHMSHIAQSMTVPLTTTRGKKSPYTVNPLVETSAIDVNAAKKAALAAAGCGVDELRKHWLAIGGAVQKAIGGTAYLDELKAIAEKAAPAPAAITEFPPKEKPATNVTPAV